MINKIALVILRARELGITNEMTQYVTGPEKTALRNKRSAIRDKIYERENRNGA